jgi:WD40 repeat protein
MKLELTRSLTLPTAPLGLAVRADGSRLYAACMDGGIYELDPAGGEPVRFGDSHGSYASGCVLLPGGRTLISAGYDGQLLWHDVEKKSAFRRVQAHGFWSWQLALAPDGSRVASVSGQYLAGGEKYEPAPAAEPTVRVFDTLTGEPLQAFDHTPPVLSTAFSPDGRHLATANMMGEVRVWDLDTGAAAAGFSTPDFTSWGIIKSPHFCGGIYGLAFTPDGASLLACGMGPMQDPMAGNGKQTWQQWAWREHPPRLEAQIRDGDRGTGLMETLAHTPDGTAFLMAGRQAQGSWNAALFSAADGALITSLDTKSRVTRARFAPEGKSLFLAATPGQPNRENGVWRPYGKIHVVTVA